MTNIGTAPSLENNPFALSPAGDASSLFMKEEDAGAGAGAAVEETQDKPSLSDDPFGADSAGDVASLFTTGADGGGGSGGDGGGGSGGDGGGGGDSGSGGGGSGGGDGSSTDFSQFDSQPVPLIFNTGNNGLTAEAEQHALDARNATFALAKAQEKQVLEAQQQQPDVSDLLPTGSDNIRQNIAEDIAVDDILAEQTGLDLKFDELNESNRLTTEADRKALEARNAVLAQSRALETQVLLSQYQEKVSNLFIQIADARLSNIWTRLKQLGSGFKY